MDIKEINNRIEETVEGYKDKIAIQTVNKTITYKELHEKANLIASVINQKLESNPNRNVGLLFDHDEKMIMGILGVIKAHKTYVPLNKSYPQERINTILDDAGSELILTCSTNLALAYKLSFSSDNNIIILNIDELTNISDIRSSSEPNNFDNENAYILYTSGSTGKPKGVIQTYNTVYSFSNYLVKELDINEKDNILLTTSYSHTVSVLDIFSSLITGATISIYDINTQFNTGQFIEWLATSGVTIIHTVPSFYRYFMNKIENDEQLSKIRLLILGGEDISKEDVKIFKNFYPDNSFFINLYGLSELILGTINVLNKESNIDRSGVPIGYPIDILNGYVLNEDNNEVSVYENGELVFEGDNLDTVYNKLPRETESLYDMFKNKRILRTGDLVKKLPDGLLEYVGRKDFQLKIQGNRVNPKEIEIVLEEINEIEKSIVVGFDNERNQKYLVAYYTSNTESNISKEELYDILKKKLPEYMIPISYIYLDNFPLCPNGKIDRDKLPKIEEKEFEYISNETTDGLCEIWIEIFNLDNVSVNDNFFHLGGNSLLATEMVNKIYNKFNVEIQLVNIFENQTIAELYSLIKKRRESLDKVMGNKNF